MLKLKNTKQIIIGLIIILIVLSMWHPQNFLVVNDYKTNQDYYNVFCKSHDGIYDYSNDICTFSDGTKCLGSEILDGYCEKGVLK